MSREMSHEQTKEISLCRELIEMPQRVETIDISRGNPGEESRSDSLTENGGGGKGK